MRYDRKTKQIFINISEFAASGDITPSVPDRELAESLFPPSAQLQMLSLDKEYNKLSYHLTASAYCDGNRIFEVAYKASKTSPVASETLILAYILCVRDGKENVDIVTYIFDRDSGEVSTVTRRRTGSSLSAAFDRFIGRRSAYAEMLAERCEKVLPTAAEVKFPYSNLRSGQRTMMNECYDAMRSGSRLFVQAPTGIGKTMSALYPAVKFLGAGRCDKIFYLTAKGSTQAEAYRAAGLLFESGAALRTVILAAKEQLCLCRDHMLSGMCDARACKYSHTSEKRMAEAVNCLLLMRSGFDSACIMQTARKFGVCPHELSLTLAEYCEIIISDYNYIFNPSVRLKRFFDQKDIGKYVFLIDEAHNLADRARDIYSAELDSTVFSTLCRDMREILPEICETAEEILAGFAFMRRLCADNMVHNEQGELSGYYLGKSLPAGFTELLETLGERLLAKIRNGNISGMELFLSTLFRQISKFVSAASSVADSSVVYCEVRGEMTVVRSICLDPSSMLSECMDSAVSSILFSATLTPLDYFTDILGGGAKSKTLALASPFDRNNLFISAVDDISTRFEDREKTLKRTVSYIAAAVSAKKGNYIAYFPSYDYMSKAARLFETKYPSVCCHIQKKGMTPRDREEYLANFKRNDGRMRVGFCVLGGSFSEGIDLPGNCLIGVVIVGAGVPGISSERNIMRDHYDATRESGYDYAYTYPGMNNILQAAGRVIRGDNDRGVVVLIDDRFSTPKYIEMYPEHWTRMKHFNSPTSLNASICDFWKQKP